jgi:hypothetical protein
MNIFKKLGKILSSPAPDKGRLIYLYVQCNKCSEKLRARVDLYNELTPEYDGKSDMAASYVCRKVLIGEQKCYQPIELKLKFDKNHKLIEQEIYGGKYIDQAVYNH